MWAASDLPVERKAEGPLRAGQLIRHDVVVCGLTDTVAGVSRRIAESPYGFALVTSPGGVLLGRLRRSACDVPLDTLVEAAMEPQPHPRSSLTSRPRSSPRGSTSAASR